MQDSGYFYCVSGNASIEDDLTIRFVSFKISSYYWIRFSPILIISYILKASQEEFIVFVCLAF